MKLIEPQPTDSHAGTDYRDKSCQHPCYIANVEGNIVEVCDRYQWFDGQSYCQPECDT